MATSKAEQLLNVGSASRFLAWVLEHKRALVPDTFIKSLPPATSTTTKLAVQVKLALRGDTARATPPLRFHQLDADTFAQWLRSLNREGGKTYGMASFNAHRAMLTHLHQVYNVQMTLSLRDGLTRVYRELRASASPSTSTNVEATLKDMSVHVYELVCAEMLKDENTKSVFAWSFLTLLWTLKWPPQHVARLTRSQLSWCDGALHVRPRSSGEVFIIRPDLTRPTVCPVLALAVHWMLFQSSDHDHAFLGTSQTERFYKILLEMLEHETTAAARKQSEAAASGATRADQTDAGASTEVANGVQHFVGFGQRDDEIDQMLQIAFGAVPPQMHDMAAAVLAIVVHHLDFLRKMLPPKHPFFATALMCDADNLERLKARLKPANEVTTQAQPADRGECANQAVVANEPESAGDVAVEERTEAPEETQDTSALLAELKSVKDQVRRLEGTVIHLMDELQTSVDVSMALAVERLKTSLLEEMDKRIIRAGGLTTTVIEQSLRNSLQSLGVTPAALPQPDTEQEPVVANGASGSPLRSPDVQGWRRSTSPLNEIRDPNGRRSSRRLRGIESSSSSETTMVFSASEPTTKRSLPKQDSVEDRRPSEVMLPRRRLSPSPETMVFSASDTVRPSGQVLSPGPDDEATARTSPQRAMTSHRGVLDNFDFRDKSIRQMWILWVCGRASEGLPPFRDIKASHCREDQQNELRDLSFVMLQVEARAKARGIVVAGLSLEAANSVFDACSDVFERQDGSHSRKRRLGHVSWHATLDFLRKRPRRALPALTEK